MRNGIITVFITDFASELNKNVRDLDWVLSRFIYLQSFIYIPTRILRISFLRKKLNKIKVFSHKNRACSILSLPAFVNHLSTEGVLLHPLILRS